ncbi:MAG: hypothetical protein IT365_19900 [Candidatus Hydrogenedentes bacterium]|nr:hypothetical protein [Candidatus Hydrogenedentota bacterium]
MKYALTKAASFVAVLACLCLFGSESYATPPPPPPDLATELEFASFAGVIECLEQGPRVSRFRAVESWFGEAEEDFWLCGGVTGGRYAILMWPYAGGAEAEWVVHSLAVNSGVGAVWIPRWPSPLADRFQNFSIHPVDANGVFVQGKAYGKFATLDEMKKEIAAHFEAVRSGIRVKKPVIQTHSAEPAYRVTGESTRSHRKTFRRGFSRLGSEEIDRWVESYLALLDVDPGYVCRLLKRGQFLELHEYSRGPSYVLTDVFCQTRSAEQVDYLEQLSLSSDPMTSMIAAMHLYFRSSEVWRERVEIKASGNDAIATWAALILACDGDKAYVEKALRICAVDDKSDLSDVSQRYLRYWLLSLFNNSARASGVEPPIIDYLYEDEEAADLKSWWSQHRDRIELIPLTRVPIDPRRVFERLGTAGGCYWHGI